MNPGRRLVPVALALAIGLPLAGTEAAAQARSADPAAPSTTPGRSKLLLTGGVSSIDGAAGGGLTPWAVVGSSATEHEFGATAFITRTRTQNYGLTAFGAALGWRDRVEVSLARQELDAGVVVPGTVLRLDVLGVKVRLAGDAILDSDSWMPQVALGLEYKHSSPGAAVGGVLDSVDAKRSGVDVYLSATKLFLENGVLANATLRATRANQNGLLGFGSADTSNATVVPEVSVALLLRRNLALGAEYRRKPNHLAFAGAAFREDHWKDLFVAWAPSKQLSVTVAYVDLGNIVGHPHQGGGYVSAQFGY